ncbi:MAG TPA: ABC transporter substrate-binding protein [Casimicrobiaceae bacterium]|nr:ABC transporter substrate-binding protein [Casimicrobiaceae bacterium]
MFTQRKLAAATLALALCAPFAGAAAADNYDINVILPQTGGASFLGKAEMHALELVQKTVNASGGIHGKQLQFKFYDDQSSPQTAVQMANQVLATKPSVMIGPAIVAMCNAVAPLVKEGPVMYCMSPGIHPPAGSYVFTSSVSTHDLENALIRYFRMKGWTRIALITSTDASGQDAERGVDEVLKLPENKDVKLVERVHFNPTDVSVAAQIERVKAAKPQAFIAWSTGAPIATIFKGIVQAGLDVPVATTDGNMTYTQMTQYAAFLPKQLYFPSAAWAARGPGVEVPAAVQKAQDEFYAAYKAEGAAPDAAANHGWGPAMTVIDALRKLPENATAAQVRDYLAKQTSYAGINGVYDFQKVPQRGLSVQNAIVTRWDAAQQRWEPVSKATGIPLAN